jgi:hypothetical protein
LDTFRNCTLFEADLPDDHIEDDDGRVIQFGGQGVTKTIAACLRGPERAVSEPQHEHEHGWTFEIQSNGARVWFQISNMEDDVFMLISKGYGRNHAVLHLELLNEITSALAQDARFKDLKWYRQEELFAGFAGAAHPLEPEGHELKDDPQSRPPASVYSFRHVLLMARIRPWAHFEVDIPDEIVPGATGPTNYGKRPAVKAISEAFDRMGYSSTWPIPKGKHRWSLYVRKQGRMLEFRFRFDGSAGRVFCKKPSLFGRYWHFDDEKYIAAIADLDAEMRRDQRFRNIRWQHGWPLPKASGTDSPFNDAPELAGRAT